ncbi:MAG: hypothetical protein AB7H97_17255 [Pseudobdellovibrionaceae bacterium]
MKRMALNLKHHQSMVIDKVVETLIALAILISPKPIPTPLVQPTLDELLSYECARSVSTMVRFESQVGPVFSDGLITLASTEARDGSNVLILNAGAGNYAVALGHDGVHRMRFQLPTHLKGETHWFFVSFIPATHNYAPRVLELAMDRPPAGRDELDYTPVTLTRADKMIEHYEYAIFSTVGNLLNALTEGKVPRSQFEKQKPGNCNRVSSAIPSIARNIRRDLDVVEMIVMGPEPKPRVSSASGRMPASVQARGF